MAANGVQSTEIYSRVIYEKVTDYSSRRFIIRLVQFPNSQEPYVGISKLWLCKETNQWLFTKTGHVFLPLEAWLQVAESAGQVTEELKRALDVYVSGHGSGKLGPAAERVLPTAALDVTKHVDANGNGTSATGYRGDGDVHEPTISPPKTQSYVSSAPSFFRKRGKFDKFEQH